MKVVTCTIVVITSNLIRKITLNMLFSAPCCEVQQIFFFWLSMVMRSAITTLKLKEVSTVNGMFPELQTALSIFQKQVAIAESGSPLTLFQLQLQDFSKGYKPSPFFKMGQGEAETHFEKWTRLYIRGIARLQPKLIYIARCPISQLPIDGRVISGKMGFCASYI